MAHKIGVSTLSIVFNGARGKNGTSKLAKIVNKHELPVQLVPLAGWTTQGIAALAREQVLAIELLEAINASRIAKFMLEGNEERFQANINVATSTFANVPIIGYEFCPNHYVHFQPELGTASQILGAACEKRTAGVVLDTWHMFRRGVGNEQPVAKSVERFCDIANRTLGKEIPVVFHLQPWRIPQKQAGVWSMLATSSLPQLQSFLVGKSDNPLKTMLLVIQKNPEIPVIIELDPKLAGPLTPWGLLWLIKQTKQRIQTILA